MSEYLDTLVRFPVPAYGLGCPVCKHWLDGLPNDLCPECGERFELGELLSEALAHHDQQVRREAIRILATRADPGCPLTNDLVHFFASSDQYSLPEAAAAAVRVARQRQEGARSEVEGTAAEAGTTPEEQALVSPPGRPFFSGRELPIPDFGWRCHSCNYELRGLTRHVCPECGTAFDPEALLGSEPAVSLCSVNSEVEYAVAKSVLDARQIPYRFEAADTLGDTLRMRVPSDRKLGLVKVPREFYFDAVFWLRWATEADQQPSGCGSAASDESDEEEGPDWTCPDCNESVPGGFDMCWKCCRARPE
jgi:ssDNA-binding Zn-finger/Zn-ribbon topoisomerase 1